jgi:hypothetical protein
MKIKTLIVFLLVLTSSFLIADSVNWIKNASWNKELGYNKCKSFIFQKCRLYTEVHTKINSINVGERITIYGNNNTEIDSFVVKGIAFEKGRCWITSKPGESDTYLTVSDCKK